MIETEIVDEPENSLHSASTVAAVGTSSNLNGFPPLAPQNYFNNYDKESIINNASTTAAITDVLNLMDEIGDNSESEPDALLDGDDL